MTDKELADRVVALGAIRAIDGDTERFYNLEILDPLETAWSIVRDWRVAGALMEKCANVAFWAVSPPHAPRFDVSAFAEDRGGSSKRAEDDSLPRAIISACVEALEAK